MGMGPDYGPPPKIVSLMAIPASSASITLVVIMRTGACIAVRRTSRMQSTRERRSPSRPSWASRIASAGSSASREGGSRNAAVSRLTRGHALNEEAVMRMLVGF